MHFYDNKHFMVKKLDYFKDYSHYRFNYHKTCALIRLPLFNFQQTCIFSLRLRWSHFVALMITQLVMSSFTSAQQYSYSPYRRQVSFYDMINKFLIFLKHDY